MFQSLLEVAQRIEAVAVELLDPARVNLVQRHRVQVVELFSTLPNDGHEVRFLQLLQVLRHALACHVQVLTECRECLAVLPVQQVKQTPAARVSQRFEYFVDVHIIRYSIEVHHRISRRGAKDAEHVAEDDASVRPVAADMGVVRVGGSFPGFHKRLQAHQIDRPLGAAMVHEFHRLLPTLVLEEDDGMVACLFEIKTYLGADPFRGPIDHLP